ncbi:hypothetical protein VKT23_004420 [Stygiomarasmius scandens]|uniref:Coiled-coil domain-containing protein 12 n=1 Tax=Marasmiellus scandens TaxID=2682957 RepID=A0ABR1JVZ1_9AGAR
MSLAETAEARKARLLALKKKKEESDAGVVKNRNFDPQSRTLKKHSAADDVEMEDTIEKNVHGLAQDIISRDEQKREQELDIFNIAPKRPNWDLKRETDKKLARLERRTQEAIHTLIRQRLAAQKGDSSDIVGAMKAQERSQTEDDALSDED